MTTDLVKFEAPPLATVEGVDLSDFDFVPDRIKIPAGGGTAFEIPNGTDRPDVAQEIVCVVVHFHKASVLWLDSDPGNNPPDAYSNDGITQVLTDRARQAGASEVLEQCKFNQWGSISLIDPTRAGQKGKATKNLVKLYIVRTGEMLPLELTLPPTSIKPWNDFVLKRVLTKGLAPFQVVTKISLEKTKSDGGIAYSRAQFELKGVLPEDIAAQMREYADMVKSTVTREPVAVAAAPAAEPVTVVDDFSAASFEAPELL